MFTFIITHINESLHRSNLHEQMISTVIVHEQKRKLNERKNVTHGEEYACGIF